MKHFLFALLCTNRTSGPPERILVYYGGTGRSMFLGILRVTTILLFGGACLIIAPSCYNDENAWYITPLGMSYLLYFHLEKVFTEIFP